MRIRVDIAAAVIALLITGDGELARFWFAAWHIR